ncbi:SA1362 family protein [Paenibacillus lentus]|uniref:DUF2207 domain-containing protein n=1 Tax=Paenibacillus lentus TaxID=1338368 RepID=A0A3Q8SBU9_9BACL|nr:SA1362 family protein [Paenibacillus lentus]AZK47047.1 hypothetical protein EIM92_13520 [Paenibacillus lentus]
MKKQAILFWIIIGLAAFGVVNSLFGNGQMNWSRLLIPVVLLAIVVWLYKFPPRKYRARHPKVKPSARTMAKLAAEQRQSSGQKRKHYPFQVIEGNKGKNDEDMPKYH